MAIRSDASRHLIITTLAEYQTAFWIKVADRLRAAGRSVSFLSFDDRSTENLRARGHDVHAPDARDFMRPRPIREIEAVFARFGIDDPDRWFVHERANFAVTDRDVSARKLAACLEVSERACAAAAAEGRDPVMIQELGGFLSVVGAYFAARRAGFDHLFIEPSFFKGRLFFLLNGFEAPRIAAEDARAGTPVDPAVAAYLDAARRDKTIVIPRKDSHQYRSPFAKIVNLKNARRLVEKLVDKHLLGKRQEFGHIGHYVSRHLSMIVDGRRLARRSTPLADLDGPFVYYPLHVPGDMALTLRSPACLDQIALIDRLAQAVPAGTKLAVKEHPAMIGAIPAAPMIALLDRHRHLVLLDATANNYDVLSRAAAVVSVNSKSGAEAILLGRPVMVLGDAFYRHSGLARALEPEEDLADALAEVLAAAKRPADEGGDEAARARRLAYFGAVWDRSLPGELYVDDDASIEEFARALGAAAAAPC